MQDERTIAIDDLETFCAEAFRALGVTRSNAQVLAGILVEAELRGHASHGCGSSPTMGRGSVGVRSTRDPKSACCANHR